MALEEVLAIESPDCEPRLLGAWAVARVLGRLDAKALAAETAGAAAGIPALGFTAQPAEADVFELGEESGKLVPGQEIAVALSRNCATPADWPRRRRARVAITWFL
jgi:hypothetical protein